MISGKRIQVYNQTVIDLKGSKIHYFPINQHRGEPLLPIVKEGDCVKVGQKIADTEELVSTPVHSSISGTVKEVTDDGVIVIENDFKNEISQTIQPIEKPEELKKREKLWIIRDAGITDSEIPAHIKLNPEHQAKSLIITTAEHEPYVTSCRQRIIDSAVEIIEGVGIVRSVLDVKTAYIGIEKNKRDAIDALRLAARYNESVEILPLKAKHLKNNLVLAATGKKVPKDEAPGDFGIIITDIETVYNIWKAFKKGMPVTDTLVTVSGDAVNNPGNYKVPLGMTVSELIERAGGLKTEPQQIIMGSYTTGKVIESTDVPVTKNTSTIIALQ